MPKRFTKQNWIDLGLEVLGRDGPDALTVEELCNAAGKTRGSFYFHFETIEAYLIALTEAWHNEYTVAITELPLSSSDRLDLLNLLVARLNLPLESGIRQLAQRQQVVQDSVVNSDETRINWLSGLYYSTGQYSAEEADSLARIEYAAFTGFKLIAPDMKPAEARDLYNAFLKFTDRA